MKINLEGSYSFDTFTNKSEESMRLKRRAQMRMDQFIPLLQRHGLEDGMRVLEIGCGHGVRTVEIARNFPASEVIGLDVSKSLLSEARAHVERNLSFLEGNGEQLPFADGSLDFVYARLVFMHLKNPMGVMKEVRRVLRPGGTFLIEDADREFMQFYPRPAGWDTFWKTVQDGQRSHLGDPNVGKKLEHYFKLTGYADPTVELQPIHGQSPDVAELCDTLMPALNEYLPESERQPGVEAIRELKDLCLSGPVSMYHLWFAVSGRKGT